MDKTPVPPGRLPVRGAHYVPGATAARRFEDEQATLERQFDDTLERQGFCGAWRAKIVSASRHSTTGVAAITHLVKDCDRVGLWAYALERAAGPAMLARCGSSFSANAAQALVKLRRWRVSGMRVKVVETETGRPIDDLELEGLASRQTSDSAALRA